MSRKLSAAQYLTAKMRGTTKRASEYISQRSGQAISTAGSTMSKGINAAGSSMSKGINAAESKTADGLIAAGKAIHNKAPLTNKVDKNINNLWLGRREGLGLVGLSVAGAVGVNAFSHHSQPYRDPRLGQVDYNGTAPIMDGDGVGKQERPASGNAPTMGATGDMVFGMHQARKGMV